MARQGLITCPFTGRAPDASLKRKSMLAAYFRLGFSRDLSFKTEFIIWGSFRDDKIFIFAFILAFDHGETPRNDVNQLAYSRSTLHAITRFEVSRAKTREETRRGDVLALHRNFGPRNIGTDISPRARNSVPDSKQESKLVNSPGAYCALLFI